MMQNKFILDSFEWSFSKINAYETCPYMFYMIYIKCLEQINNAFAEWGKFGHVVLEKYFKKELEFFELSNEYVDNYFKNVKCNFPPNRYVNLNEKYYNTGKEYFDNFEGMFENCEILGVEEKFKIKIGKYDFVGVIDLILRDENGIIIDDHKSKSKFKSKKEKEEYFRQLYIYSMYIYQKYGEYPHTLIFNMFRANDIVEDKFDIIKLEETKSWVLDTIEKIYQDIEFKTNKNQFFCDWLCGCGIHCNCSNKYVCE